ncbi:class I SAM-dependent methyltransferase [Nonomuraea basaltis]|uniref:class I SAM-dependent methyltransferase n=1 Tax=Nonomuraea basaltis TaxID=2495887 RepID=UPI00110C4CD6|nr:class I SAM-dependent methyltransferase [Nonomuraea basaltis]TMR95644.1 class I SAM-dependent methyltransferase [Nonomuraea basaltis]
MQHPDAIVGWDDERNAELYDRFTREHPFYADASRDLASRADLADKQLVIDLCGGTGVTAAILLDHLPPHGRVISLDSAPAMQTVGQRTRDDPRITWIVAKAENIANHIPEPADAVVCNSAIWKTDTPTVFTAVKRTIRPGGRFVFNIGGGFAGLTNRESRTAASLNDLIIAIAVADYGYVPHQESRRPPLTPAIVEAQLAAAGFSTITSDIVTRIGTVDEKRAWLSIPLFARPPGQLTHTQRIEILHKAYDQVDKTQETTTRWLVVTAQA